MEAVFAISVGITMACGIYLALRRRSFSVVLGLSLISYATNLFLFSSGRLVRGKAPIYQKGIKDVAHYADPIPQALVLTAIVIGLAMTAFAVVLALRMRHAFDDDCVDGQTPEQDA